MLSPDSQDIIIGQDISVECKSNVCTELQGAGADKRFYIDNPRLSTAKSLESQLIKCEYDKEAWNSIVEGDIQDLVELTCPERSPTNDNCVANLLLHINETEWEGTTLTCAASVSNTPVVRSNQLVLGKIYGEYGLCGDL